MKRILLAAALALSPATVQSGPLDIFSDIFVFGDSLSDPGNLLNALTGAPPASVAPLIFPKGQITDGDAWAAQIGADFASGTNFAFAAARAVPRGDINFDVPDLSTPEPDDLTEIAVDVPDFADQIALYNLANPTLGANPLAAVWFGGNDLRDAFVAADPATALAVAIPAAAAAIASGVQDLVNDGLTTVAVFGLPNLGRIPEIMSRGTGAIAAAAAATVAFNDTLRTALTGVTGADLAYVDIFGLFEEFAASPAAFGFTNIQTPCIDALLAGAVTDCSGFLFYDDIHPTEAAHAFIAERFTETVAPIPLPATAGLLALGLAGLLVLRRRSSAA